MTHPMDSLQLHMPLLQSLVCLNYKQSFDPDDTLVQLFRKQTKTKNVMLYKVMAKTSIQFLQ